MKRPGAHGVSEHGLSQQSGAVMSVLNVRDRDGRVVHAVIHHRVNGHCHAVLRQHLRQRELWLDSDFRASVSIRIYLLRRYVVRASPQIDASVVVHTGQDEKDP